MHIAECPPLKETENRVEQIGQNQTDQNGAEQVQDRGKPFVDRHGIDDDKDQKDQDSNHNARYG